MKKNRNYNCYRGILHTFGDSGSTVFHKRIYYRLVRDDKGNHKAKEILTGEEFPTCYGVILNHQYLDIENFVSGDTEVYDYEIDKYLNNILSDKMLFKKEIQEILLPKTIMEMNNTTKKKVKK